MAESEEELKSLLRKVKVESKQVGYFRCWRASPICHIRWGIEDPRIYSISHEVMGPDAMIFVF